MSEITPLVTTEAVREVLRPGEVRSVLKQKPRQNLEARLDIEVNAILGELLGVPTVPKSEDIAGDGNASDDDEPTPDGDMMMQARAGDHRCVPMIFTLLRASEQRETGYVPDGRDHNRRVIYHVSGGNRLLVPTVAGQGFPASVGGNRHARKPTVWAADVSD